MKPRLRNIVIIVALVVIAIVVVASLFPPVSEIFSSGTIGKADKYRKEGWTEKDLKLRSEFVSDTVKLHKLIIGLDYFYRFSTEIGVQLNSGLIVLNDFPVSKNTVMAPYFQAVKDFTVFIANNDTSIASTLKLLRVFNDNKEKIDQTMDVEKNLMNFGSFVGEVVKRDSVLEQAARKIDSYLQEQKTGKKGSDEKKALLTFRDLLIRANLKTAIILNQHYSLKRLKEYAMKVSSNEKLADSLKTIDDIILATAYAAAGVNLMVAALEAQSYYHNPPNP